MSNNAKNKCYHKLLTQTSQKLIAHLKCSHILNEYQNVFVKYKFFKFISLIQRLKNSSSESLFRIICNFRI